MTPPDRHLSAAGLHRLLDGWHRSGPAYTALADAVRAAVLAGSLPLSTRVPSERELAAELGVSRTTTSSAYQLLRDEGFLASRQGSGTVTTLPEAASGPDRRPTTPLNDDDAVIDLSIAAPAAPSVLHQAYVSALDSLPRFLDGRGYAPTGIETLREAVARRYTERGVPTSPDQILVTGGAQSAINLLLTTLVSPGDRVVVEHPTYPQAIVAARSAGARPVPVPVGPHGTDLDLLESTVRQVSPRLVYLIPDHHNPTGTSLSAEGRARVREIARRHRTVVVGDEALTDLTLTGAAPAPFAGDGTATGVVTVGSASKSFWGGLRIGWIRAHPDLVARLSHSRGHVDIATAVLEQLVTAQLIDHRDDVLPARRTELRDRRDLLLSLLADQLPGWHADVPAGGLVVWADIGAPMSSALCALALRHGVRLAAGPAFGVDGGFERNLRLPYTEAPETLARGVSAIAAAWAALGSPSQPGSGLQAHTLV